MSENVNLLDENEIAALEKDFETLTFQNDFDLVYENQVPNTGIALIEGQIDLIKNSKVRESIHQRSLIGITQLMKQVPVEFGFRVKAKSRIILLGKSDILGFEQNKKSKLHSLFKAIKTG